MPRTPPFNENEVTILARVLAHDGDNLAPEWARQLLALDFSDRDRARMHDLAVRNQDGALSDAEKEELFGYAKAGCLLGILHSRARRALKGRRLKPATH